MRGWEDTIGALPARIAPPEVGITTGVGRARGLSGGPWRLGGAPLCPPLQIDLPGGVAARSGSNSLSWPGHSSPAGVKGSGNR